MTELLSLKQESNICIVYHNNYFTCTLLNSDKNSALAKVAGNGKSPDGEGREGFTDKLSGWADIGGYCQYTNNRICKYFFTFCAFYIDQ